jgi:hypothetical protein
LVAHRHGVDRDLCVFGGDHDHDLEQVPSGVGADEQPSVGIFAGVFECESWSIAWTMSGSATPCLRADT